MKALIEEAGWILLAAFACTCSAQDSQFLPEVNAHVTFNSRARLLVQAKDDREGGDEQQFTFGPSIALYFKPLLRLKHAAFFNLDNVKKRMVVFESGYRIITAPGAAAENRAIEAVTFHLPVVAKILLSDRNRADLD